MRATSRLWKLKTRLYLSTLLFLFPLGWGKAKSKWLWESGVEDCRVATSLVPQRGELATNLEHFPGWEYKNFCISGATEILLDLVTTAQPSLNNSFLNWITSALSSCSSKNSQDYTWMWIRAAETPWVGLDNPAEGIKQGGLGWALGFLLCGCSWITDKEEDILEELMCDQCWRLLRQKPAEWINIAPGIILTGFGSIAKFVKNTGLCSRRA